MKASLRRARRDTVAWLASGQVHHSSSPSYSSSHFLFNRRQVVEGWGLRSPNFYFYFFWAKSKSFWPCFPFQHSFLVLLNLIPLPNYALASAVQWRSEEDEEEYEKYEKNKGKIVTYLPKPRYFSLFFIFLHFFPFLSHYSHWNFFKKNIDIVFWHENFTK